MIPNFIRKYIKDKREKEEHHKKLMSMPYFQGQDVVLKSDLSKLCIGKELEEDMEGAIVRVEDVNPYTRIYKVRKDNVVLWIERRMIGRDKSEGLEAYIGW